MKYRIMYDVLKLKQLCTSPDREEAEQIYKASHFKHLGLKELFGSPNIYHRRDKIFHKTERGKFNSYY